ncbi:uncharacterized protein BJX67DRAFT_378339 [Aspergillus lucknowensis]|uniref:Arrestin-like N-terminal domain-containing protein n=1 Tax=Aspergillus lucknowensis TaxID=176173 RepID=A0ABR4M0N1_9EURO
MLTITLTPPTTYAIHDQISGCVTYTAPDQGRESWSLSYPIRLLVTITGHTEVEITSAHRAHAEILRLTVVDLYASNASNTWPFRFPFPDLPVAGTDPETGSRGQAKSGSGPASESVGSISLSRQVQSLQRGFARALPPSFSDASDTSRNASAQGNVEYTITASINLQYRNGGSMVLCSSSAPITYAPRNGRGSISLTDTTKWNPSAPTGKKCTVRSSLLVLESESEPRHESKEDESVSAGAKTRPLSRLWGKKSQPEPHSQLPHFNFELFVVRPVFMHVGSTRTCLVNILPWPKTSSTSKVPEFRCKQYRILLIGITSLFTASSSNSPKDKDPTATIDNEVLDIHKNEGWDVLLSAENGYTTRIDLDIPASEVTVPSFATYNVERRYVLQVEVWIECLGETFYLENRGQFSLLVPFDRKAGSSKEVPNKEGDRVGDAPPPYPA